MERSHKEFVAQDRQATIYAAAAWTNILRQRSLVLPDRPASPCIQRKRAIVLSVSIHDSVHHQRRRFEFSARHGLISPLRHQFLRVCDFNFLQRRKSSSLVIPRVHQPVLRFLPRIQQSLRRDLSNRCRGKGSDQAQTQNQLATHLPPPTAPLTRNASRSCKSFSGRPFSSYAGINDSRDFRNDFSDALSNECTFSRVSMN